MADIASQGYYLSSQSQPFSAISGLNISFREYVPGVGLLNGNLEDYDDSTRGRIGQNFLTLNNLKWKQRRWTVTGGDFRFHFALIPVPFTNYVFPEVGVRGAKVEMADGRRHYTFFRGQETLQEGPRIAFRVSAPQDIAGATVQQSFGAKLQVSAGYLGFSSSLQQLSTNPAFFAEGSEFRRTDTLFAQSSYAPTGGLSLFAGADVSRVEFAEISLYPHSVPVSWLGGMKWTTRKLTITADYGSLSRSALPAVGNYFGDRRGPFAEVKYRPFRGTEVYVSGTRSANNLEDDPFVLSLSTWGATAGASMQLLSKLNVSGQYSILGLAGVDALDSTQNQTQRNAQYSAALTRPVAKHTLMLTGRELSLKVTGANQVQKSVELQDTFQYSRFSLSGAVRVQQQDEGGQIENSLFVRGGGQVRLGRATVYVQFQAGDDLINKTLFATNTSNTTVAGVSFPLARGWSAQAEAFRTTVLTALNPENILVLQSEGQGVSDILNDFNQWSFYFRLSHQTHWGALLMAEAADRAGSDNIPGSVQGFVYTGATGSKPAPGVSVSLDKTRTTISDASGQFRFDDVAEGSHAVELDMAELAADRSPGPAAPPAIVKPRKVSRVDLRVVEAGSAIRGIVDGLAKEDEGAVRLDRIAFHLDPSGADTDSDGNGAFAFYNLEAGKYVVRINQDTLPEGYSLASEPELPVAVGEGGEAAALVFRIRRKVVPALPVHRVFDGSAEPI